LTSGMKLSRIKIELTTELTMVVSLGTGIKWKNVFCPIIIHHLSRCGWWWLWGFTRVNFWCVRNLLYYYLHGDRASLGPWHVFFLGVTEGGLLPPRTPLIQLHFCHDIYGSYQLPTCPKKKKRSWKSLSSCALIFYFFSDTRFSKHSRMLSLCTGQPSVQS
jgi:hypothetical protein